MNDDWLSLRGSSVESFPFGMSPTVNRDNREVVLSDCHVYVWMWIPVTLSHLQSISYWRWRRCQNLSDSSRQRRLWRPSWCHIHWFCYLRL